MLSAKLYDTSLRVTKTIYAGQKNFLIAEAFDLRRRERVKVISKDKIQDPKPWKVYSVKYRDHFDPKYGPSLDIMHVTNVTEVEVTAENCGEIIASIYGLEVNKAAAIATKVAVTKKLALGWHVPLYEFKEKVESIYPTLSGGRSLESVSYIERLCRFWPPYVVGDFKSFVKPSDVWEMLCDNPLALVVPRNLFGIPPLKLEEMRDNWIDTMKKELPDDSASIVVHADALDASLKRERSLSILFNGIFNEKIMHRLENQTVMFACDAILVRRLGEAIERLMCEASTLPMIPDRINAAEEALNQEQVRAFRTCCNYRVVGISGPAGTGKSLFGALFLNCVATKHVLMVSVANLVARSFAAKYEKVAEQMQWTNSRLKADNIANVIKIITNRTEEGLLLQTNVQMLLIEESSMLDYRTLLRLIELFPKLKWLGMFGDSKQLGPVSADPSFFHAFTVKYSNHMPLMRELKTVMRTADPDLLHAMAELRERRTNNLVYSDDPRKGSFCIIPRAASVAESVERIMKFGAELDSGKRADWVIITQKRKVVHEFNRCMFMHLHPGEPYDPRDIHIGEKIVITRNCKGIKSDFKTSDGTRRSDLDTAILDNNSLFKIEEIIDYPIDSVLDGHPTLVKSTGSKSKFQIGGYQRIIVLNTGERINCSQFSEFTRGYAATVYSYQGSEADYVWFYLHSNFTKTLEWTQVYTAASRAKKKTVLECTVEELALVMTHDSKENFDAILESLPEFDAEKMMHKAPKQAQAEEEPRKKRRTKK